MIEKYRDYFNTGETRSYEFRINQLNKLKNAIKKHEKEILKALYNDLGKPEFEAYATEIGIVYEEINYAIKNLKSWMKRKKVKTPITQMGSKSYIYPEPRGVVWIIAPWNYPFNLLMVPLIGAISAGNTIIVKSSKESRNISFVITKIIEENFDHRYIGMIKGGREEVNEILEEKLDYIFFTGSVEVGKKVMKAASKNLTPITLELGGKSPVILDKSANIKVAAKRIAWGKFLNVGQTCVAPDYLIVHKDLKDQFIKELMKVIKEYFGDNPKESKSYGRIINERHFNRLINLIDKEKLIFGGDYDCEDRYIGPTIVGDVNWNEAVMAEEIFGPILPIMTYDKIEDTINMINSHPKPLALYIFSEDKNVIDKVVESISYGGGCINDTVSHTASVYLPFGGIGNSGMGAYHGKVSFDLFSHLKSVLNKSTKLEIKIVFPPYEDKLKWIKKLMK